MPFEIGLPEMVVVLVLALLFLGPKRLPEAGRALGSGIREFKDGVSGADRTEQRLPEPRPPQPSQASETTLQPPAASH